MSSELKPCPFCGSTNIGHSQPEGVTMCRQCGSEGYWDWNTRPLEDALIAQVADLRRLIVDLEHRAIAAETAHESANNMLVSAECKLAEAMVALRGSDKYIGVLTDVLTEVATKERIWLPFIRLSDALAKYDGTRMRAEEVNNARTE